MNRRHFLKSATAACAAVTAPMNTAFAQAIKTRWIVRDSEGFDALSFLSPLSGDPFYYDYYKAEVEEFAPRMPAVTMEKLKGLMGLARSKNILLSPFLDLRFSAGPDATIDDLLESAAKPDERILPSYRASPYWSEESWEPFTASLPTLIDILLAFKAAGFGAFRRRLLAPNLPRFAALRAKLATFDVVGGAEIYTGRKFDPTIEIILLHFNKPHGIKVIGQRFLSGISYHDEIHIRTAGHELLHPPVDTKGVAFKAAKAILERDALITRVVAEHDPKFGYTDLEGLIDEDLAEALDQLIAERFGVANPAGPRWAAHDDGMHILAAAFYGLMQADGFARTGGNLEQWLASAADSGKLAPKSLHAAAARVIGRPADKLWPPANPGHS